MLKLKETINLSGAVITDSNVFSPASIVMKNNDFPYDCFIEEIKKAIGKLTNQSVGYSVLNSLNEPAKERNIEKLKGKIKENAKYFSSELFLQTASTLLANMICSLMK